MGNRKSNILSEMTEEEKKTYENEDGWLAVEKLYEEISQFGSIIGARNVGKTYGWMKFSCEKAFDILVEDYDFSSLESFKKLPSVLKTDFQFVFLRRHGTQAKAASKKLILKDFYKKFLDQLPKEVLEKYEVSVEFEGSSEEPREVYLVFREIEMRKNKKAIHIGFIGAISMAEKFRGPGIPEVKIIIVDEFQAKKKWDYIQNEPAELEDIYESIGRLRCGTGDIKVILLGNAGTILNPYFYYYGYDEFDQMKTVKREGEMIFYHLPNKAKRSEGSSRLIKGSAYAKYAIDNDYADNQDFNVLRLKDAVAPRKCLYNIFLGHEKMAVWSTGDGKLIISRLSDEKKPTIVNRVPVDEEIIDIQIYVTLANRLKLKNVYFDSPDIRLIAEKNLSRFLFQKSDEWETF